MSIRYNLSVDPLSDPIEVQLRQQGLTLGKVDYIRLVERWAAEISNLRLYGLLTEAESDRARKRLMEEIQAAVRPLVDGEVK